MSKLKTERTNEPEIVLVTANAARVNRGHCMPGGCPPNVPCNPNISCSPFNCAPALRPCMPECAPATPCNPTQGPLPPRPVFS